uniref:Uncharacterized protein n=1 Tax=viral metagenome TaxID=1070528 RepID=A0A6C0IVD4_9ZZZZ
MQISSALIIQPQSLYNLELPKDFDNSINIKLEIKNNDIWATHNSYGHDYLSIIVDPINDEFQWYVPFSLTKYWKNETRLRITDIHSIPINEHLIFQFEGFDIDNIRDSFLGDDLDISWMTNSEKNFTINLVNADTRLKISDEFKRDNAKNNLKWNLNTDINPGKYYITINDKYKSNIFNIKSTTTSTLTSTSSTSTSTLTSTSSTSTSTLTSTSSTTTLTSTSSTATLTSTSSTATLTSTSSTSTSTLTSTSSTSTSILTSTSSTSTATLTSTSSTSTATLTSTSSTYTLTSTSPTITNSSIFINYTDYGPLNKTDSNDTNKTNFTNIPIIPFIDNDTPDITKINSESENCHHFCSDYLFYLIGLSVIVVLLLILILIIFKKKQKKNKIVPNQNSCVSVDFTETLSSCSSTDSFEKTFTNNSHYQIACATPGIDQTVQQSRYDRLNRNINPNRVICNSNYAQAETSFGCNRTVINDTYQA